MRGGGGVGALPQYGLKRPCVGYGTKKQTNRLKLAHHLPHLLGEESRKVHVSLKRSSRYEGETQKLSTSQVDYGKIR